MTQTFSPNAGLPYIDLNAQKHLIANAAFDKLDALLMLTVLDRDLTTAPGSPVEGNRLLVPAAGWSSHPGKASQIAHFTGGAWSFYVPRPGWLCFVADEKVLLAFEGAAWVNAAGILGELQNLTRLGLGTTADATNPLSAKLNNVLLTAKTMAEGGDGDLRAKLSKESAGKTVSVLFQDNYSGRAEFGLTGDDDFHLKVSADGSVWHEAIRIDRASGRVAFAASGGPREVLSANRTYYVRTDGSDTNNGLGDNSAGAFLTIQKAVDAVALLDINAKIVTIQVRDGTYTGAVTLKNAVGFAAAGNLVIQGNAATPANVLISVTGAHAFTAEGLSSIWDIKDLKITTAASGFHFIVNRGATLRFGNIDFGACPATQIFSGDGGRVACIGSYTISGSAQYHMRASGIGFMRCQLFTTTLVGTPYFSGAFICAQYGSTILGNAQTFAGAATGARYAVTENSVIVAGGGAGYFPGDVAGGTGSGGQYL